MARRWMGCVVVGLLMGVGGCGKLESGEPHVPGSVSVSKAEAEAPVAITLNGPTRAVRAGELFVVAVALGVEPGYEIHAREAESPSVATKLELKLPRGLEAMEDWAGPEAKESVMQDGQGAHEGLVVFTRKVRVENSAREGTYEVGCAVTYQACGPTHCLRPVERTLSIRVQVE